MIMMLVSQVLVAATKNVPKDVVREMFHASKSYAVSRKWWSAIVDQNGLGSPPMARDFLNHGAT